MMIQMFFSFLHRLLPLVLFAILFAPAVAAAQGTAVLSGRVLDSNSAPVGFATIVIENTGSGQPISGALAGENGRFVMQGLANGSYTVRITFPGFLEAEADVVVSPLNQIYDLGDIRLPRIEGVQEQVTVTAETIRAAGIDTQVFTLGDGPVQPGRRADNFSKCGRLPQCKRAADPQLTNMHAPMCARLPRLPRQLCLLACAASALDGAPALRAQCALGVTAHARQCQGRTK